MGNEGINKLAGVFQNRIKQIGEKPQILDFGTIQEDMSLITNKFPKAIPKDDYMVCRTVTLPDTDGEMILRPGRRVFVAWTGDDPCIIDVILSGKSI